jgi:hypothetical protein
VIDRVAGWNVAGAATGIQAAKNKAVERIKVRRVVALISIAVSSLDSF